MDSNTLQLRLATVPAIDDILRDGARRALQSAIEREAQQYIERNGHHLDDQGRRLVVRNGHHPARTIQSGNGPIEVKQPRVNDKRLDERGRGIRFTSRILPPYLRKTKAIEELVPWLYLKGISTSDFPEALACLGHDGSGLGKLPDGAKECVVKRAWSSSVTTSVGQTSTHSPSRSHLLR